MRDPARRGQMCYILHLLLSMTPEQFVDLTRRFDDDVFRLVCCAAPAFFRCLDTARRGYDADFLNPVMTWPNPLDVRPVSMLGCIGPLRVGTCDIYTTPNENFDEFWDAWRTFLGWIGRGIRPEQTSATITLLPSAAAAAVSGELVVSFAEMAPVNRITFAAPRIEGLVLFAACVCLTVCGQGTVYVQGILLQLRKLVVSDNAHLRLARVTIRRGPVGVPDGSLVYVIDPNTRLACADCVIGAPDGPPAWRARCARAWEPCAS